MNYLLWTLQIILALYYLMGAAWMLSNVPKAWLNIMPKPAWMAIGGLQALCALGLVLPGLIGILPGVTSIAAIGIILLTVPVAARTTKYPGVLWSIIPAIVAAFVAYARHSLLPL